MWHFLIVHKRAKYAVDTFFLIILRKPVEHIFLLNVEGFCFLVFFPMGVFVGGAWYFPIVPKRAVNIFFLLNVLNVQ